MRFAPSEEQTLIQDTLDRVLQDQWDRSKSGQTNAAEVVNSPVWKTLTDLGLLASWLPEEAGGAGGGPRALLALSSGFGRHQFVSPFLSSSVLGSAILLRADGEVAQEMLAKISKGEVLVTVAVHEAGARYSLDAPQTSVVESREEFRLSGGKVRVLDASGADEMIVSATGPNGAELFLVSMNTDGVVVQSYTGFDGTPMASIAFNDVKLPLSARISNANQTADILDYAMTMVAFSIAAEVLGACEAAMQQTLDYMRIREQFGRPIARFQALQFRAADMNAEIEMLRSLVFGAMNTLGDGMDAHAASDVAAAAAMATRVGDLIGRESIHMHGAIGMTEELGIGRYLMRINTICRLFGDASHHQTRFLDLIEAAG